MSARCHNQIIVGTAVARRTHPNQKTRLRVATRQRLRKRGPNRLRDSPASFPAQTKPSRAVSAGIPWVLVSTPMISPAAPAAAISLPGVVAVLAKYWPVASGLKWHCGLLAASGTGHCCASRFTPGVSSATSAASSLLIFLRLAARFAPLRSRIATFLEECLIFAGKREFLPAVATD